MSEMRRGTRVVNEVDGLGEIRISPTASKQISDVRKQMINRDVENGIIIEAGKNYQGSSLKNGSEIPIISNTEWPEANRGDWDDQNTGHSMSRGTRKTANHIGKTAQATIAHSVSFRKQASIASTSNSSGYSGGAQTDRLAPEVYSPLFTMANLNLPRDRITINTWCFLPETLILMADGTRKPIENVKIGDLVISAEGNTKKVTTLFQREIDEEIVGVKIEGEQETIWTTQNHGFKAIRSKNVDCKSEKNTIRRCKPSNILNKFCSRCNRKENPYNFEKISAGELEKFDIVYCPKIKNEDQNVNPIFNTKEGMELIGYYLSEGYISKNELGFVFGLHEKETVLYVSKLIENFFDYKPSIKEKEENSVIQIRCYNKKMADFFELHCGRGAKNKKLSQDIVLLNPRLLKHLLKTWMDGDGHQYKKEQEQGNRFNGITTSENLAWQLKSIALKCNLVAHIYKSHNQKEMISPITKVSYKTVPNYLIRISGKSAIKFSKMFKNKKYRFNKLSSKKIVDGCSFIVNNKLVSYIDNIEKKQYNGKVYNIEVEDDHTYVVGPGIAVFNCRNFYDLHPIVRNCITLHATYPISKLNIRCPDQKVEQFFDEMVEEMDLLGTLGELSLEFWKLGEVVPYALLDESEKKWKRINILNPDFVHIKKAAIGGYPIISLRPDEALKRLVMSSHPADQHIRSQIPEEIIHHVRKGENIPLDNFNTSHLKMLSSPYDIRGTSIIVSTFKDLMLYDKLRECYSEDTEFLTENGFKKYDDINSEKLATMNQKTGELEYQNYIDRIKYHYNGEMKNFISNKLDILVTPNHRMWLSKYDTHSNSYKNFDFINAKDVTNGNKYKSRAIINWHGDEMKYVNVLDINIPIKDYLEYLGYLISEGSVRYSEEKGSYCTAISQSNSSPEYNKIEKCISKIGVCLDKKVSIGKTKSKNGDVVSMRFYGKKIASFFKDEVGSGAHNKRIPGWVKELSPNLLEILLRALVDGDGRILTGELRGDTTSYSYSTVSKQLANDVQEIAFKCGYAPVMAIYSNGQGVKFYYISWSLDSGIGEFPYICNNGKRGGKIKDTTYDGNVVCFTVPNSLLVVRRNGKISVQGNCKFAQADGLINPITLVKVGGNAEGDARMTSEDLEEWRQIMEEAQYDKDFKIITHAGVTVERVGASGQVLDVAGDIELIVKNIYTGLMVPQAVVDTESAVYSSASIGLEVLRQRYFNFRNLIAKWLVNKIFAPISKMQGFFEYKDGEKKLIVPEIEWNHMNLYDLSDYIQTTTGLLSTQQCSLQTIYRSIGLNYEEEKRKQREEMIDLAKKQREEQALTKYTLEELRSMDPSKDIQEASEGDRDEVVTDTQGAGMGGDMGMGMEGGGNMGMGDMGGMGELAPPPSGELGGAPGGSIPGGGGMTPEMGPGAAPPL